MMETFYITQDQFWEWFERDGDNYNDVDSYEMGNRSKQQRLPSGLSGSPSMVSNKRMKTDRKPRNIVETEAASRTDSRYIIMYGRHKPGKKSKVWEDDGYLSLVGQMAHLCDLRGRMIEEPTVLDEIDYKSVEELGELVIGNTEVKIIELDK